MPTGRPDSILTGNTIYPVFRYDVDLCVVYLMRYVVAVECIKIYAVYFSMDSNLRFVHFHSIENDWLLCCIEQAFSSSV